MYFSFLAAPAFLISKIFSGWIAFFLSSAYSLVAVVGGRNFVGAEC